MPEHLVIDGDTHIVEQDHLWDEYLEPRYRGLVGRFVDVDGREVLMRDGVDAIPLSGTGTLGTGNGTTPDGFLIDKPVRWAETPRAGWDPKERLVIMDGQGVDAAVFFPTMSNVVGPHPYERDAARAITRAYNRMLASFLDADRSRLFGCAIVPHAHPDVAVEELRYAVDELGLCGLLWPPQVVNGRGIVDPANDQVFAAAQELGVPLVVHISIYGRDPVVGYEFGPGENFFDWVALGHVIQNQAALAELMRVNLPERFPRLRIGLFEGGVGWVPYLLERYDEYWEKIAAWQRQLPIKPSRWFREHRIMVSGEGEECLFPGISEYADHIIFAGDYPHFDYDPAGPTPVLASDGLTSAHKRAIFEDNPSWFFGIKVPARTRSKA